MMDDKPNAAKVAPEHDPDGSAAASSAAMVVGYPIVGLPDPSSHETRTAAHQPLGLLQDRSCSGLCFFGNCILVFDLAFWSVILADVFVKIHLESTSLGRLMPCMITLAAAAGLYFAYFERPIPRGCGCIQSCGSPRAVGCESCPMVPWLLGISGILGFAGAALALIHALDDPDDGRGPGDHRGRGDHRGGRGDHRGRGGEGRGGDDRELDYDEIFVHAVSLVWRCLEMALGFCWLHRYSERHHSICCKSYDAFAPS